MSDSLVAAQLVHDDDVPGQECVEQLLIDPGAQGAAIDQQRQQPISK